MTVTALILLALTGVVYFTTNEGWTGPQAFYWTVTTMTVRILFTYSNVINYIAAIIFI